MRKNNTTSSRPVSIGSLSLQIVDDLIHQKTGENHGILLPRHMRASSYESITGCNDAFIKHSLDYCQWQNETQLRAAVQNYINRH